MTMPTKQTAMFRQIIPTAIRPIHRFTKKIAAQKLRFIALAAAFAFLSLNLNAASLDEAVKNRNLDEVNRLIAAGTDVNAKEDKYGVVWTPLHFACNQGHEDIVRALIEADADVDTKDEGGWTPLHWSRNVDVVSALLAASADVNAKTKGGWTPLHMAVRSPRWGWDFEIINALLASGANVNTKSTTGWTPLHMVARHGHVESINALVTAGADLNALNDNGETPLDVAILHDGHLSREILILLSSSSTSPAEPGEPMEYPIEGTSALTIERVGEERTEVRWKGGVLQFSPNANGWWRDVILDQGFFRLRPQD